MQVQLYWRKVIASQDIWCLGTLAMEPGQHGTATAAAITRTACRCLFFNAHQLRRLSNKADAVKAALGASVAASVREKLVLSNVAAAGRAHI